MRSNGCEDCKIDVQTPDGKKDGTVELPAELFDVEPNIALMHQVVTAQLAAKRQGTHSTKTRGEVSGGGKKPYRQKGTGRARQGSTRAPQFTGGGVVHGPQPRDYSQRTPKKMIAAALRGALSDRARNDRIHAITEVVSGQTPSTKGAKAFLATLTDAARCWSSSAAATRSAPRACAICLACTCSRRTSSTPTTCSTPTTWCSASRRWTRTITREHARSDEEVSA